MRELVVSERWGKGLHYPSIPTPGSHPELCAPGYYKMFLYIPTEALFECESV